jgi:hypothetical protein
MHRGLKMSMDDIAMHMRASKTTIQRHLDAHRALTDRFFTVDNGKYAALGEGKWSFFEELFKNKVLRERAKEEPAFVDSFCRWVGEGRLRQGADVRLLPMVLGNQAAAAKFQNGEPSAAFGEAKKLVAQLDPAIDSDFFKLLSKVRESVTSAAQVKELLRIRQDRVAREQIVQTYERLVDFMNLANVALPDLAQGRARRRGPNARRARKTSGPANHAKRSR